MRRLSILLALVASLAVVGAASAAPNRLRTEVFGTAQAVVFSSTSAGLVVSGNDNGVGYAAVYTNAKSPAGKLLIEVDMGFIISAGGKVAGGAPRLTIPIDFNGDGVYDDFASLDAASCGGTVDATGLLTSSVLVSTTSSTCAVTLNSGAGGTYANWDAFAAANPTYRIAKGQQAFIIADWGPTNVTLTGIDLN